MTEAELHNLLTKISAVAVFKISGGSQDYLSVSDCLLHVKTRPLVGAVQITDVYYPNGEVIDIDFAFSPDFLEANNRLVSATSLGSLTWRFRLPSYDFGDAEKLELFDGDITIRNEEGVGNWISRGVITSNTAGAVLAHCSIEDLHNSYFAYEKI